MLSIRSYLSLILAAFLVIACGEDDSTTTQAGTAGQGGSAGIGGRRGEHWSVGPRTGGHSVDEAGDSAAGLNHHLNVRPLVQGHRQHRLERGQVACSEFL